MRDLCPEFNTNRMVREYTEKFYLPAYDRFKRLSQNSTDAIKSYRQWMEKIKSRWDQVKILEIISDSQGPISVNTPIKITAKVQLGDLTANEVLMQAYIGPLDSKRGIIEGTPVTMEVQGQPTDGVWEFNTTTMCRRSGRFGYSVRVLPAHPELVNPFELGFIHWAETES